MKFIFKLYYTIIFFSLNFLWNYRFWIFAERIYDNYEINVKNFRDNTYKKKKIKRFVGYKYKGKIYNDNPGFFIKNRKLWDNFKKNGLL